MSNYIVNNKREPIMRSLKTEHCPTCKQPLSFLDAVNDYSPCKCGKWWYVMNPPQYGTSLLDDNGWHFKAVKDVGGGDE